MDDIIAILASMPLNGKFCPKEDIPQLEKELSPYFALPDWLIEVYRTFPICGTTFEMTEQNDQTGVGVLMEWLDPSGIALEALAMYPGIAARELSLLPFGSCECGTGDPYFLDLRNPSNPPVLRMDHETVSFEEKVTAEAIGIVAPSLTSFLNKASLESQ